MHETVEMEIARIANACGQFVSTKSTEITPVILDICQDFAVIMQAEEFGMDHWWGWFVKSGPTPSVIAASASVALLSLGFAVRGYFTTKKDTRLRATLDTVWRSQSTEVYRSGNETFTHYAAHDPRALGCLANKNFSTHQRLAITTHLNNYEEIAGSCNVGILDKKLIRRLLEGIVTETWEKGAFFIYQNRWMRDLDGGALLKYKVLMKDGKYVDFMGKILEFDDEDTNKFSPNNGDFAFLNVSGEPGYCLDREKGKPRYKPKTLMELETLARKFDADKNLFPKENGRWALDFNKLDKLEVLRIRKPVKPDQSEEDYEELNAAHTREYKQYKAALRDLVKMSYPLTPGQLNGISTNNAYPTDVDTEKKVLGENDRKRDWSPETVEDRLLELTTTLNKSFAAQSRLLNKCLNKNP
ncbi:MAG: DUF4760 domain-containing protein [Alphaproteobacteria bacterium]